MAQSDLPQTDDSEVKGDITHIDPRHQRRQAAVQELFAHMFTAQQDMGELAQKTIAAQKTIDPMIVGAAPAWPIDQINKIDLAILRLAIHELLDKKQPIKVVIDEAVELAKEFGSESSPSFVNGVLGKIVEDLGLEPKEKEPVIASEAKRSSEIASSQDSSQ